MKHETILILNLGGPFGEMIARRVRDLGVYCEVVPCGTAMEKVRELAPIGIILAGGPETLSGGKMQKPDPAIFSLGLPVLGISGGMQLMAEALGGETAETEPETGKLTVSYDADSPLFQKVPQEGVCQIDHRESVIRLPEGFEALCHTEATVYAGMANEEKKLYALAFHPEVEATQYGADILKNFLYEVAGASGDWSMHDYAHQAVETLREQIGDGKVLLALSGGVDSSVCAALLDRAIGENLTCILVDHGLMRKNEANEVVKAFEGRGMKLIRVDAGARFLGKLAGVTDPETKRKIIGEEFIRVFEEESKKLGKMDFLAQGTIYPDVIESGTEDGSVIKSHHNVGGLPEHIDFRGIIEPLRQLFKDEVRRLGLELGLPETLVWRQPFPGPGLAVRVIGEITEDRLAILREADAIFREEITSAGLHRSINQYFAVLTNIRSVGVHGEERTYDYTVALRGVITNDFMTAEWARIPYDVLERVSARIVREVPHVNRIVYDITSKPPATIEWE